MNKQKFLKETANFSLHVLIIILLTRIWAISLFYLLGNDSQIAQSIVSDPIHHHHLGLALIILAILLRKHRKAMFLAAMGLGIFLEEWAVFLKDIGLNTNHLYLTKIDFFSIIGLVGLIYILSKALYIKMRLKNI
jgi:hypothetical protein